MTSVPYNPSKRALKTQRYIRRHHYTVISYNLSVTIIEPLIQPGHMT